MPRVTARLSLWWGTVSRWLERRWWAILFVQLFQDRINNRANGWIDSQSGNMRDILRLLIDPLGPVPTLVLIVLIAIFILAFIQTQGQTLVTATRSSSQGLSSPAPRSEAIEPLREVFRLAGEQAYGHLRSVLVHIGEKSRSRDSGLPVTYSELLEEAVKRFEIAHDALAAILESDDVSVDAAQEAWVAFSRVYEEWVLRVRDTGTDAQYGFLSDANYQHWKRFDAELRQRLRELSGKADYPVLRKKLLGRVETTRGYWA